MGADAQGIIMYTPDGYVSAQLQASPSADVRGSGPVGKYIAYSGPFYLDESGQEPILKHHMTVCNYPDWVGETQRRLFTLKKDGEKLLLQLAPDADMDINGEKSIVRITWRKLELSSDLIA